MARFLEITWLVLSVVLLGIGIKMTISAGFHQSFSPFALAVLSILMYLLRRNKRIKNSK